MVQKQIVSNIIHDSSLTQEEAAVEILKLVLSDREKSEKAFHTCKTHVIVARVNGLGCPEVTIYAKEELSSMFLDALSECDHNDMEEFVDLFYDGLSSCKADEF